MMTLNACPKCKGALFLDHDDYGWYKECVQCGYTMDCVDEVEADSAMVDESDSSA